MGCTDIDASKMDETLLVKGCLGRLPCSRPVQGKSKVTDKRDSSTMSPRARLVSKPSAVVLPSPRQISDGALNKATGSSGTPVRENVRPSQTRQDAIKGTFAHLFHIIKRY